MSVLEGVTIVEMAGIVPGPFCGMLLADLGADVGSTAPRTDLQSR
jgi:alpha-methylacyl-CoA racemase